MNIRRLLAPRTGSARWLVLHELRLAWRGMGGKGVALLIVLQIVLGLILHGIAWLMLSRLPPGAALPPLATIGLGIAVWVGISLLLAQAILQSVAALFDRGDLDLLLASPLPTRSVFLARGLGIAAGVSALPMFILTPLANVGLFTGHAGLLALYPALAAVALGLTALGIWLTLGLVRLLGARRARTVAQVLGSLVGGLLFLASQVGNLMGAEMKREWAQRFARWLAPGGPLAEDSPLWFPARALLGEPLPLLVVMAVGAGSFWAVVNLAHRRFLSGTQESVTGSARRGALALAAGSTRFRAGLWRNVLLKEWRLILRDPQLITQTLMQLIYLLPVMLLPLRSEGPTPIPNALAPAVVWLAASLVSNLAWITVAAEDAPDLLGSSPNPQRRLRWLKLLAAMLPVWVLVSPFVFFLARGGVVPALVFLVCLVGATVSVGTAQISYPREGRRNDMKQRMKSDRVVGLVEVLVSMGWAGTAFCLLSLPRWAAVPVGVALAGSGVIWWLGRERRAAAPVG